MGHEMQHLDSHVSPLKVPDRTFYPLTLIQNLYFNQSDFNSFYVIYHHAELTNAKIHVSGK